MRTSTFWALAPFLSITTAFKDTSPFFLFSTSELLTPDPPTLITATSLRNNVLPNLEECPSDTYVIVSQPGVNAADYTDKRAAPLLRKMMSGDEAVVRSSAAYRDVVGAVDAEEMGRAVREKCGAGLLRVDASTGSFHISDDMRPRVISLDFQALPTGRERAAKLAENDAFLASVLDLLPSPKYTVVYTTTPSTHVAEHHATHPDSDYQMDSLFQYPVHMDLKRDFSAGKRASDGQLELPEGPLFERYSFLSPGIFMGILVSIILLSILYVGISAVASLQVSYAAFDKEMGPVAQKKAQ